MGDVFLFGMHFSFFDILMFAFLIGLGVYSIYTALRVRREWSFFESRILLPVNCLPEDCTDPEGFFSYYSPRLLGFGIGVIFSALVECGGMVAIQLIPISSLFILLFLTPGFALIVWMLIVQRKAAKRFW